MQDMFTSISQAPLCYLHLYTVHSSSTCTIYHELYYRGYSLGDPLTGQHPESAHQARGYNHLL
jgi:hypothetical protein